MLVMRAAQDGFVSIVRFFVEEIGVDIDRVRSVPRCDPRVAKYIASVQSPPPRMALYFLAKLRESGRVVHK